MDYTDISNVRRIRWYRSANPELPMEEWEMVADLPFFASNFKDDAPQKTGITHYYSARYVYKDGKLSGFSDPKECPPITSPEQVQLKQRADLN